MTIDVEDYFHVEAFSKQVGRERWDDYPLRVESNTRCLLDLLDRHDVKATFFVLGWVARKAPRLIAEIAHRGHEIACHSLWHRLVYNLTPEEFRADLREATSIIEDAAQTKLLGYRAPTYSITKQSLWALEILAEEGYTFDSSIFPIRHDLYGYPEFVRFPVQVQCGHSNGATEPATADGTASAKKTATTITEFTASTVNVLGKNLPGPGGGYLRIFPLRYALWALSRIGNEGKPATVYLHPWEVDPEQPRIPAPVRSRMRHYTGLGATARRLEKLLATFRFAPMGRVLEQHPPTQTCSLAELKGNSTIS